jgi:hypothetical protein
MRYKISDRLPIPSHREALTCLDTAHDLRVVVSQPSRCATCALPTSDRCGR